MKTVITDLSFVSLDLMRKIFTPEGIDVEILQTREPHTIIEHVKTADAILVGMAKIDKAVIDALEHCKVIGRFGVGYDAIDVAAATSRGILVVNVPDFCTEEVADHTIAMLLVIARKLIQGHKAVQEGLWGPKAVSGTFLRTSGQTLGLYGFGRISRLVAERAKAFKINCIACDLYISRDDMSNNGVEKVEMRELLERSDYISLHAPLTKDTENAFGLDEFKLMKKTAWLINTSRGAVIREEDLVTALDQKLIAGAALDVLAKEPPDRSHPLLNRENVIITPHIAFMSLEGQDDVQIKAAEEVVKALKGERPIHVVNPEVLSR